MFRIEGEGIEDRYLIKNEHECIVPAVSVDHVTTWVNGEVNMPFDIKMGESSVFGVFLSAAPKEGEESLKLKAMDDHFRSAILGKVIFNDSSGRIYRDVDIKGMGAILPGGGGVDKPLPGTAKNFERGKTPWGYLDRHWAEVDRDVSERLMHKGLRTHRALAILELKQIVDENGNKISINQARKRGYIKHTTVPAVEVRAFGTRARIGDCMKNIELIQDAKNLVEQELKKELSNEGYLSWFATTLGEQVAIIHNEGLIHDYLTAHNITLDCRIVDNDMVEELPKEIRERCEWMLYDINYAIDSLKLLFNTVIKNLDVADQPSFQNFGEMFKESYLEKIDDNNIRGTIAALIKKGSLNGNT
jgi:hypothetical protein